MTYAFTHMRNFLLLLLLLLEAKRDGQIWQNLAEFGRKWQKLAEIGKNTAVWQNLEEFGRI